MIEATSASKSWYFLSCALFYDLLQPARLLVVIVEKRKQTFLKFLIVLAVSKKDM